MLAAACWLCVWASSGCKAAAHMMHGAWAFAAHSDSTMAHLHPVIDGECGGGLAVLRAHADERGAQAIIGAVADLQQPLVQLQCAAPGGLVAAQRRHKLVQLAVVAVCRPTVQCGRKEGQCTVQKQQSRRAAPQRHNATEAWPGGSAHRAGGPRPAAAAPLRLRGPAGGTAPLAASRWRPRGRLAAPGSRERRWRAAGVGGGGSSGGRVRGRPWARCYVVQMRCCAPKPTQRAAGWCGRRARSRAHKKRAFHHSSAVLTDHRHC